MQLLREPQPILAVAKPDVAQRDGRSAARLREREPFFRGAGLDHAGTFGFDPVLQQLPQRLFVVDNQNAHHRPIPAEDTLDTMSSPAVGSPSRSNADSTMPSAPALRVTVSNARLFIAATFTAYRCPHGSAATGS